MVTAFMVYYGNINRKLWKYWKLWYKYIKRFQLYVYNFFKKEDFYRKFEFITIKEVNLGENDKKSGETD